MKNNLHTNAILLKTALIIACFMLTILYNKSMAAEVNISSIFNRQEVLKFTNPSGKIDYWRVSVKIYTIETMPFFSSLPEEIPEKNNFSVNNNRNKEGALLKWILFL